jgi:Holliday junction DNA helicase RuvA
MAGAGADWADITIGGGITLRVSVPDPAGLGHVGERVRLFTSLQVREDSLTLYGFRTDEARSAFAALLGVNGVGPRVALNVLTTLTTESLALAISGGDPSAFKGVSGVGTKTANRIVLELKGKLDFEAMSVPETGGDRALTDALTALGYTVPEAMLAISTIPAGEPMSLEDKVRFCLSQIGGG